MSEQQVKSVALEVVREAYAAFASNDIPWLLNLIDPEAAWEHPASDVIPWAGIRRGHSGVIDFFAALAAAVEFEAFEPRAFFSNDDGVVVLGYERLRVKDTGRRYETHWAHAFTVSGGKITLFREHTDTALIAQSLREASPD